MKVSTAPSFLLALSIVSAITIGLPKSSSRRSSNDCVLNKWEIQNGFRGHFTNQNRSITDESLYRVFNTTQNGLVLQLYISAVRCYREDDGAWRRCQDICDPDETINRCKDKCPVMYRCLRGTDGYQELCFRTLSDGFVEFHPLHDVVTPGHSSSNKSSDIDEDLVVKPTPEVLSSAAWYSSIALPYFTIIMAIAAFCSLGFAIYICVSKIKTRKQRNKGNESPTLSLNIISTEHPARENESEGIGLLNENQPSSRNENQDAVHDITTPEAAESPSTSAAHAVNGGQSVNDDAAVDIADENDRLLVVAPYCPEKFPPYEAVSN